MNTKTFFTLIASLLVVGMMSPAGVSALYDPDRELTEAEQSGEVMMMTTMIHEEEGDLEEAENELEDAIESGATDEEIEEIEEEIMMKEADIADLEDDIDDTIRESEVGFGYDIDDDYDESDSDEIMEELDEVDREIDAAIISGATDDEIAELEEEREELEEELLEEELEELFEMEIERHELTPEEEDLAFSVLEGFLAGDLDEEDLDDIVDEINGELEEDEMEAKKPKEIVVVGSDLREDRAMMDSFFDIIVEAIEVESEQDLQLKAAGYTAQDQAVKEIKIAEDSVEVEYDTPGKLFGFIPVKVNQEVKHDNSGEIEVDSPWWQFVVSGVSKKKLEQELSDELASVEQEQSELAEGMQDLKNQASFLDSALRILKGSK